MSTLRAALDRLEIHELLARYARAVDRCDAALFGEVWTKDARLDYGQGETDAASWSEGLIARLGQMSRTQHMVSNILVSLDGDTATSEAICLAWHHFEEDGMPLVMVVGGRYLDRHARTADGWRIAHRRYVMDWTETHPSTLELGQGRFARFPVIGARKPDDLSYA